MIWVVAVRLVWVSSSGGLFSVISVPHELRGLSPLGFLGKERGYESLPQGAESSLGADE